MGNGLAGLGAGGFQITHHDADVLKPEVAAAGVGRDRAARPQPLAQAQQLGELQGLLAQVQPHQLQPGAGQA